jgi:hypothetical protein
MHRSQGSSGRARRRLAVVLCVTAIVSTSCGGGSDAADTTTSEAAPTTAVPTTTEEATSSTDGGATSSTGATTTTALPDASEAQRTAPGDGTGTALLTAVRVGRNEGFDRIVFEFEGEAQPGYRIQWTDGLITADGSGEPVEVDGEAYLEMVLQPASGVDLSSPELRITYEGPDRIDTAGAAVLTDLVRTGDFEAVLSWAAGAEERAPFRVLTLSSPTRVVVDVAS